jgi:hypothetical protein
MIRTVQPELLDILPADDPHAIGSRRDLVRLNTLMQHGKVLADILGHLLARHGKARVIELGAGDGTLLLDIAQRLNRQKPTQQIEVTLVDRQKTARGNLMEEFQSFGWTARIAAADVFDFLEAETPGNSIVVANLFLHHFNGTQLKELFALAAKRANAFVALEPRRSALPLFLSSMVGLIGCNSVTRHDAPVSVRAGFRGHELSHLWPAGNDWKLNERPLGLCSHVFIAERSN